MFQKNSLPFRARSLALLLPMLFVALLASSAGARSKPDEANDTCLACHGDKTMTTKRAGRTVSVFVDSKRFGGSVHGSLNCTACHADLEGKDLPHEKPKRVNCGMEASAILLRTSIPTTRPKFLRSSLR